MARFQFDKDKFSAAWRDLSDTLGRMSWRRFALIAFLGMIAISSLGDARFAPFVFISSLGAPLLFTLIIIKILAKDRSRAELQAERAQAAAANAQGEASAWKTRLDAHFLFNAMATIEYLIESDPKRALVAQRALASYLRSGLSEPERSTAKAQSAACEAYLTIQKIRMGDRLQSLVSCEADAPMPGRVAIAALEEAVSSCVESSIQGGRVDLRCHSSPFGMRWEMSYPERCDPTPRFEPLRLAWLSLAPSSGWSVSAAQGQATLTLSWIPPGFSFTPAHSNAAENEEPASRSKEPTGATLKPRPPEKDFGPDLRKPDDRSF